MYSKILILRFPKTEVEKPIVCYLVKDYNLTFNILNASVLPRKEGIMVLELTGTRKNFQEGVKYLRDLGVHVQNASQEIKRVKIKCTHCGACTAVVQLVRFPFNALKCLLILFRKNAVYVNFVCLPAQPGQWKFAPKRKPFFKWSG